MCHQKDMTLHHLIARWTLAGQPRPLVVSAAECSHFSLGVFNGLLDGRDIHFIAWRSGFRFHEFQLLGVEQPTQLLAGMSADSSNHSPNLHP